MELSLSLSLFHISFSFRHVSTLAQRYVRFVLALFLSLTLLLSFATRIKNSLRRHNIWPRRCSLGSPFFLFFSSLSFFFSAKSCNETSQLEGKLSHLRREADLEERRAPRVFRGGRIDSGSFFFKLRADIAIN